MDGKRVNELLSDETFVSSLVEKETPEEVQAAFKEKGVDISLEELNKLRDGIIKANSQGGELSTEDLDDVAGGATIMYPQFEGFKKMIETVQSRRW